MSPESKLNFHPPAPVSLGWSDGSLAEFYSGLPVLVTGGCGFIGSNLVHALVGLDAQVTVLDALIPGCGWHYGNLGGVESRVKISNADMRNSAAVRGLLDGVRVVFNLAGEISHLNSMLDPQRDLAVNASAQLAFLDTLRQHNPATTVVYAKIGRAHV